MMEMFINTIVVTTLQHVNNQINTLYILNLHNDIPTVS